MIIDDDGDDDDDDNNTEKPRQLKITVGVTEWIECSRLNHLI